MIYIHKENGVSIKVRENPNIASSLNSELAVTADLVSDILSIADCDITISVVRLSCYGEVVQSDDTKFWIYLSKDSSISEIKKTLIHELCHVQQVNHGLLQMQDSGDTIWMGELYQYKDRQRMMRKRQIVDYDDYPWEIDANRKEPILSKCLNIK